MLHKRYVPGGAHNKQFYSKGSSKWVESSSSENTLEMTTGSSLEPSVVLTVATSTKSKSFGDSLTCDQEHPSEEG